MAVAEAARDKVNNKKSELPKNRTRSRAAQTREMERYNTAYERVWAKFRRAASDSIICVDTGNRATTP
jgi:thiamine pyrophosphate-dependent acetolactate synthase large subunit-like protein